MRRRKFRQVPTQQTPVTAAGLPLSRCSPGRRREAPRCGKDPLSEARLQRQELRVWESRKIIGRHGKRYKSRKKGRQKENGLGGRVPWGTQPTTPGQGTGNKASASGQKCSGCAGREALVGGRSPLGMPGAPAPRGALSGAAYLQGAAGAHFRGLRSGRAGPSPGTRSRSPRGEYDKAVARAGTSTGTSGRKPNGAAAGAARGVGRGVPASALTCGRAEPRRRWRSPSQWEEKVVSFPSVSPSSPPPAPDLPSLSPAPFP